MEKLLKNSGILVSAIAIPISIIALHTNKTFSIVWLFLAILNGIGSLEYYIKNKCTCMFSYLYNYFFVFY